MVGEIRDFETAEISIRAAMTGHLGQTTVEEIVRVTQQNEAMTETD